MADYDRADSREARVTLKAANEGIRLKDQLDEQDRLIAVLFEQIKGLDASISPILRPVYEAGSNETAQDISGNLSPVQQQVMEQYNMINHACQLIGELQRRVQL